MRARQRYEDFIWWTMDSIGVTESVRWKVLLAVGIQFAVSVAQVFVPLFFTGSLRIVVSAGLLGLAILAFVNTVLVVERDIIEPVTQLHDTASCIAQGDLGADLPRPRQPDEIGRLVGGFSEMCGHLSLVARQAEALAEHDFDADVLDREMPGRFGDSLREMTVSLERYIDRVETDRDRFQLLNYLVSHDIPNIVNIIYGRIDLLYADIDDEDRREHIAVIEEQIDEILAISDMVGKLASDEGAKAVDLVSILDGEIERVRDSYPTARVSAEVPDGTCRVRGNELLNSVFANLITNGIEHNDSERPAVDVRLTDTGETVTVRVADNGPGLDVTDVPASAETFQPGTGLNIVHTVVRQFGGTIDVTESDAGGAAFVVELPRPTESTTAPLATD